GKYLIHTRERAIKVLGIYTVRIGVDSITLGGRGEWLYYGPFSGDRLYRIGTRDLNDESLAPEALGARVETFGPKTISDGLSIDAPDTVYVSDPAHSAILTLGQARNP